MALAPMFSTSAAYLASPMKTTTVLMSMPAISAEHMKFRSRSITPSLATITMATLRWPVTGSMGSPILARNSCFRWSRDLRRGRSSRFSLFLGLA